MGLWHGALFGLFGILLAGGLGLPFPEDLALIGAGIVARQRVIGLPLVIGVGLAGVIIADWGIYLVGRRYGAELVAHPWLARRLGAARIDAVRDAVERHGIRAVFFARFVLGFRIVTFLAAGTFRVPPVRFALAEAAGSAIFVPAMATLGYLFADRAEKILHGVGQAEHWLLLAGMIGLALYLGLRAIAGRTGLETRIIARVPPPDAAAAPRRPPPRLDRPS